MKVKKVLTNGFSKEQVRSWEDSDGVNFAIALARITGWLLHVDWFTTSSEGKDDGNMKSLRVYVADHSDNVFDIRGRQKLASFCNNIILPLAKNRGEGNGGVLTRYYSEANIFKLPLRVKPDSHRIDKAEEAIRSNLTFLEKIPFRKEPFVPGHIAANFTFGRCAAFAEALNDISGIPACAMIAISYTEQFSGSKLGYAHSINIYSDGIAEDVWGIQSIEEIARRFGFERFSISEEEHKKVIGDLKRNSPEKYEEAYQEAKAVINTYRNKIS